MPILEGRSLVWALRHRLRNSASIGQRCLFLTDSLTQALALSKGRSPSSPMNGICRYWGALCLASGTLASVRWIPGEVNAADEPSRVWQPQRHGEWEKSTAKRKANKDKDMNHVSPLDAESSFDRARDFMPCSNFDVADSLESLDRDLQQAHVKPDSRKSRMKVNASEFDYATDLTYQPDPIHDKQNTIQLQIMTEDTDMTEDSQNDKTENMHSDTKMKKNTATSHPQHEAPDPSLLPVALASRRSRPSASKRRRPCSDAGLDERFWQIGRGGARPIHSVAAFDRSESEAGGVADKWEDCGAPTTGQLDRWAGAAPSRCRVSQISWRTGT